MLLGFTTCSQHSFFVFLKYKIKETLQFCCRKGMCLSLFLWEIKSKRYFKHKTRLPRRANETQVNTIFKLRTDHMHHKLRLSSCDQKIKPKKHDLRRCPFLAPMRQKYSTTEDAVWLCGRYETVGPIHRG